MNDYQKFKKLLTWFVNQLNINNGITNGDKVTGLGYNDNSSLRKYYADCRNYEGFDLDCTINHQYGNYATTSNYINLTGTDFNTIPEFDSTSKAVISLYIGNHPPKKPIERKSESVSIASLGLDDVEPNQALRDFFDMFKQQILEYKSNLAFTVVDEKEQRAAFKQWYTNNGGSVNSANTISTAIGMARLKNGCAIFTIADFDRLNNAINDIGLGDYFSSRDGDYSKMDAVFDIELNAQMDDLKSGIKHYLAFLKASEKSVTVISLKEFAIKVLQDTQKPMTDIEIWEYGVGKGWDKNLNSVGKTPWQSIYAILSNYKDGSPNPDKRIKIIESEQRRQFVINHNESDKQDEEPDETMPTELLSDEEIEEDAPINKKEIETLTLNCLGGLKKEHKILKRASLFELNNGKNVLIRQSKLLSTGYFYGLQKAIVDGDERIDYLILVKGDEGFYKFPYDLIIGLCLDGSISFAEKGKSANEAVKGYRIFLTLHNDKYMLKLSGSKPPMDIDKFFIKFQYAKEDFLSEIYFDSNSYDDIIALLDRKMNIILQGAPGVGKSYMAKRLAYSIIGMKDESKVKMIQFHQNYSYEDFIEGFRPNEDGKFVIRKGIFYNFCQMAQHDISNKYFFIIDEINRGNLSKVMGELMLLLENDKRGENFEMPLTYSGESFYVPENVYVIGMMNTADRSLAMIDYALRRRFSFIPVEPIFDNLQFVAAFKNNYPDAETVIEKIKNLNSFISENLDNGHQIGHSYFCSNSPFTSKDIDGIIKYEIEELLNEYFFDDKDNLEKAKGLLK